MTVVRKHVQIIFCGVATVIVYWTVGQKVKRSSLGHNSSKKFSPLAQISLVQVQKVAYNTVHVPFYTV